MLTRSSSSSATRNMENTSSNRQPAFDVIDNIPGPGAFNGRSNGLQWLRKFELWSRCRQYTDDTKLAAIQLLLADSAATWANVLNDDQKDSWSHFRDAFIERFSSSDNQHSWQRTEQLWNVQQNDDEPVLDFIDRVRLLAHDCSASDDLTMSAVIHGMRDSLRRRVIQKEPADLSAMRRVAKTAEFDDRLSTDNCDSDAIKRIEQRLDRLTLHFVSANNHSSTVHDRSRSPSSDDRRRRTSPVATSTFSRREQLGAELQSTHYRSPSPVNRRSSDTRSPYVGRRVTFNSAVDKRPVVRPSRASNFPPCDSCGRSNHRREHCYFRWAECTSCRRVGHISSACRSSH